MAVSEARQGLKSVMRAHAKEISLVEMGTDEILLDLNTPQDYKSALQKTPLTNPYYLFPLDGGRLRWG